MDENGEIMFSAANFAAHLGMSAEPRILGGVQMGTAIVPLSPRGFAVLRHSENRWKAIGMTLFIADAEKLTD